MNIIEFKKKHEDMVCNYDLNDKDIELIISSFTEKFLNYEYFDNDFHICDGCVDDEYDWLFDYDEEKITERLNLSDEEKWNIIKEHGSIIEISGGFKLFTFNKTV